MDTPAATGTRERCGRRLRSNELRWPCASVGGRTAGREDMTMQDRHARGRSGSCAHRLRRACGRPAPRTMHSHRSGTCTPAGERSRVSRRRGACRRCRLAGCSGSGVQAVGRCRRRGRAVARSVATGRPGPSRQACGELALLVGLERPRSAGRPDRTGAGSIGDRAGGTRVCRCPVELRQRDVLLVDGHARTPRDKAGAVRIPGLHRDDSHAEGTVEWYG